MGDTSHEQTPFLDYQRFTCDHRLSQVFTTPEPEHQLQPSSFDSSCTMWGKLVSGLGSLVSQSSTVTSDCLDHIILVCLSDLHTLPLPLLPPGDILVLAGDLSEGRPSQILSRLSELASCSNQYSNIVVVGGNHDRALSPACDARDAALYDGPPARMKCCQNSPLRLESPTSKTPVPN